MSMINRRKLLRAGAASFICAPALVRRVSAVSAKVLMYPPAAYMSVPTFPWTVETPSGFLSIPSTNTQGLQEALAYSQSEQLDLVVESGQNPNAVSGEPILAIGTTCKIGPTRQGYLRFNGLTISGTYDLTGPTLSIDSQMISEVDFNGGQILGYPVNAPVVEIAPRTANVPSDPVLGVGSCSIKLCAIQCGQNPNYENTLPYCLGFVPGATGSGIQGMTLEHREINGGNIVGARGIVVSDPSGGAVFYDNRIICGVSIHVCPGGNIQVGQGAANPPIYDNKWDERGEATQGGTFLVTYAYDDTYDLHASGVGLPGTVAVVEMIGPNAFTGVLNGFATGFAYPRAGSIYSGTLIH